MAGRLGDDDQKGGVERICVGWDGRTPITGTELRVLSRSVEPFSRPIIGLRRHR